MPLTVCHFKSCKIDWNNVNIGRFPGEPLALPSDWTNVNPALTPVVPPILCAGENVIYQRRTKQKHSCNDLNWIVAHFVPIKQLIPSPQASQHMRNPMKRYAVPSHSISMPHFHFPLESSYFADRFTAFRAARFPLFCGSAPIHSAQRVLYRVCMLRNGTESFLGGRVRESPSFLYRARGSPRG